MARASLEKPPVVFVHGSWHDEHVWDFARRSLRKLGHPTDAVRLDTEDTSMTLEDHAQVVIERWQDFDELTLVGHSYGCNITTRAAGRLSLKQLVHVCGGFEESTVQRPTPAESDVMPWRHTPESRQGIIDLGNNMSRFDSEVARKVFYHDCTAEVAGWAMQHLRPQFRHPANPVLDTLPDVPTSYIVGTDDRVVNTDWGRYAARNWFGIEPIEIASGHCPMLSQTERLVQTLSQIALA